MVATIVYIIQMQLLVARNLNELNPDAYDYVMNFAKSNQLCIREDRREGERALNASIT